MQNTLENKAFLLRQMDLFLMRFPIGRINENALLHGDINEIIKIYIQFLQDCVKEETDD